MPVVKYSENPLLSVNFSPEELARLREVKNNPDRRPQSRNWRWSDDEIATLTRLAADTSVPRLARVLGRNPKEIRRQAKRRGVELRGCS